MAEAETQEKAAPEATEKPAKGKKGLIKMLIIVLAALGIAGACGYYFYGKNALAHASKEKAEKKNEKVEVGPIVSLEPFIINVSGDSSKYVKISVALELKNEKGVEHAKKITPVIRDVMLGVLGSKTPETFIDVTGRNAIKKELFTTADRLFADNGLKAVYITDIVMQ